jgi:serine/threonine protein kinase
VTLHRVEGSSAPPDVPCPNCGRRTPAGDHCLGCGAALAKTKRYPRGTVLGAYTLEDVLGEGGMGIVYLATHTRLGRRVAIKVLRSEYQDNPQAIRRFFAEARAVNTIAHANIVEVTDFVERPGEDNYYVMELLEGSSLAVLIDTAGVPELERSINIMQQLADALSAVHAAGIVHRDLKPDNVVLVEKSGKGDFVKLCDFGVAKLTDSGLDRVAMQSTSQGAILGTPEYMSPEQASGKPVDARSDIYSFGVMLYELATGRVPFAAPDFGEMVVQLLKVQPIPPSELPDLPQAVPPSLEALILECLEKDPARRPANMDVVSERLEKIAEQEGWLVYELKMRTPPPVRLSGQHTVPPLDRQTPPQGFQVSPRLPRAASPALAAIAGAPAAAKAKRNRYIAIGAVAAVVLIGGIAALVSMGGDSRAQTAAESPARTIERELAIADERIAAGRLVAPGGDEALDHLLKAKALDPKHPKVADRLSMLARKFEELADQALAAGSLAEAAAHLQTVLLAEPDNAAAAKKMADIEQQMVAKQREAPKPVAPPKKKRGAK